MNDHRHLTAEEIFERQAAEPSENQAAENKTKAEWASCPSCAAEATSLSAFLTDLKAADASACATTEWDDLLLRRRIREAVAREKAYSPSFFLRFSILRPALGAALILLVAFGIWSPLSRPEAPDAAQLALVETGAYDRLPAWTPLPDLADDEGLAVLAEWTPTEDELAIARCRAACLAGLSSHEEEGLLTSVAMNGARVPMTGASPL